MLTLAQYRDKLLGCWMGKNIGGTLGAPFEWRRQFNDVDFYVQDLHGEPLPNDDLDIQLLWLIAMEERGLELSSHTLAEYWMLYVTPHWAEYGNAKIHMRAGLMPPLSGLLNNDFKDSCGAFIRSEIWAAICPGAPMLAAEHAYRDAAIDHGDGEGVYAAVFTAALESAAFVEADLRKLIDIGLSYIPDDSGVAEAVRCAVQCRDEGMSWHDTRDRILTDFRGECFFGRLDHISQRDQERGFTHGQRGWDAPSNIAILVVGLLWGDGDFGRSLCTTVNCGEDTDCTAATLGSILGIIHGMEGIPNRWIEPIGRGIQTACLNLGELGGYGGQLPQSVDELTDRVLRLMLRMHLRRGLPVAEDWSGVEVKTYPLFAGEQRYALYRYLGCPQYTFDFFTVYVDYGHGPGVRAQEPKVIKLHVENTYKIQEMLQVRWHVPASWSVLPAAQGTTFIPQQSLDDNTRTLVFTLETDHIAEGTIRCAVELTAAGRAQVMLVPVVLLHDSLTI